MSTPTIIQTRKQQLHQLALAAARQFNLNDAERKELESRLLGRFNLTRPLAATPSVPDKADSAYYREQIRGLYIDLIAYYTQLRVLKHQIISAEAHLRSHVKSVEDELNFIYNKLRLVDSDNYISEYFYSATDKTFDNTYLSGGKLTLLPDLRKRGDNVKQITSKLFPVAAKDQVIHKEIGSINNLLTSGLGSGLWATVVYTRTLPSVYITDKDTGAPMPPMAINGVVSVMDIELNDALNVNELEANFMTAARILRVWRYDDTSGAWQPLRSADGTLVSSTTASRITLTNLQSGGRSNRYKLLIVTEEALPSSIDTISLPETDFIAKALQTLDFTATAPTLAETPALLPYRYVLGIFSIKLREVNYVSNGLYRSEAFKTRNGALQGMQLRRSDASYIDGVTGIRYYAAFYLDNQLLSRIPILPGNTSQIEDYLISENEWFYPSFYLNPTKPFAVYHKTANGLVDISNIVHIDDRSNRIMVLNWIGKPGKRALIVRYHTDPINSVGYVHPVTGHVSPDRLSREYQLRRLAPGISGLAQMPSNQASPLQRRRVNEHINKPLTDNVLTLKNAPYVDYQQYDYKTNSWNYEPIVVRYRRSGDNNFRKAVDITNWSDRTQRPLLVYGGDLQYYVDGNRLIFNNTNISELTIQYDVLAEMVYLEIEMHTLNRKHSPVIAGYEVALDEQI
jgi:hypothetical protein